MTYENEKCPVCNKIFTENDDIVVCPICGTPHHRQCYVDNKNCINEGLHSQNFEWVPTASGKNQTEKPIETPFVPVFAQQEQQNSNQPKVDDGHKMVFCPNCGKENPAEEPNCKYCGERLYNNGQNGVFSQPVILPDMSNQQFGSPVIQISPDDTIDGNKVSDVAEYIQMNANKYIPKIFKMEKTKSKVSFNWAAFLFSPFWFFFRKMQTIGFVLMLILLVTTGACTTNRMIEASKNYETVVEQYYKGEASYEDMNEANRAIVLLPESIIMFVVEAGVKIFSGIYGTYFYKKKIKKDMDEIKATAASPEEYRLKIFKRGGVSAGMCLLSVFGYYCAAQVITILIGKI